jgi:hypothetical protein
MMRHQDLLRRLSFVRYLYRIGEQQAAGSIPYSAVAILTFYDVIEWFLITACEYFGLNVKKSSGVYDYFEKLEEAKGILGKGLVNKISSARSELKHRLTIPSSLSIDEVKFSTKMFLDENSQQLFNVLLEQVSMIDLVASKAVKIKLNQAQSLVESANFETAMDSIFEAYTTLIQQYQLNVIPNWELSCGADQISLFHLRRFVGQMGDKKESPIRPSPGACKFWFDLLVETTVRVEQSLSGKLSSIDRIFREPQTTAE